MDMFSRFRRLLASNKLNEIEKIIKKKNLDVICHSEHIILESKEKKNLELWSF